MDLAVTPISLISGTEVNEARGGQVRRSDRVDEGQI
jgi:hypothetical protein